MAYTATSGPGNEITKLRDEITHEVNTDAEHIARSVFGNPGSMPDMQRVSDDLLQARYRTAYMNDDRQWLIGEAHRDPDQFVKVARSIGVQLPEELGQDMPAQPPSPPPPVAAPAPVPLATLPVPPIPTSGVSLGGVAQPAQPVPLTAPPVTQGM